MKQKKIRFFHKQIQVARKKKSLFKGSRYIMMPYRRRKIYTRKAIRRLRFKQKKLRINKVKRLLKIKKVKSHSFKFKFKKGRKLYTIFSKKHRKILNVLRLKLSKKRIKSNYEKNIYLNK